MSRLISIDQDEFEVSIQTRMLRAQLFNLRKATIDLKRDSEHNGLIFTPHFYICVPSSMNGKYGIFLKKNINPRYRFTRLV
jgi:hypothetical protein